MSIASILRPRILVAFAVAMILSASAYGFAAANTFTSALTSGAGDGAQAISGFAVSSIAYTMDTDTPSSITAVSFTLTPATGGAPAKGAQITLSSTETAYHSCSVTLATGATTCSLTTPVLVTDADSLSVVAWS